MHNRVRVLVVDDSALARDAISGGLACDPEIEVLGTAPDAYIARDKIVRLHPDVITLDVDLPRMDGIAFLRRLMPQHPLPVVMVSAFTERGAVVTLDALAAGAVDFVAKPAADDPFGLAVMLGELCAKVKIAATINVRHLHDGSAAHATSSVVLPDTLPDARERVIAVGASTGGTDAVRCLVEGLPRHGPGVAAVLHMPARFTALYASRLQNELQLPVREGTDGALLLPGTVTIAPGGQQMEVARNMDGGYCVRLLGSQAVGGHCPAVDVLFASVAHAAGARAVGVLLTGMGTDGAAGLLAMRRAGASTLAQDEASSVVFGMPRAAWELGAAERLVSLTELPTAIVRALEQRMT